MRSKISQSSHCRFTLNSTGDVSDSNDRSTGATSANTTATSASNCADISMADSSPSVSLAADLSQNFRIARRYVMPLVAVRKRLLSLVVDGVMT